MSTNFQNESMEKALKTATDEYNQKTQEILKTILETLENWEKIFENKNNNNTEEVEDMHRYFKIFIVPKTNTEKIKKQLTNISDTIAITNLTTNLLTGLKRFTNSARACYKKAMDSENKDTIETVSKIMSLGKGLKKSLSEYIAFCCDVDRVLRVMDTRIVMKNKNNVCLYQRPVKLQKAELFPTNGHPHVDDIHQGIFTKDCYLMSSLKAIVKKSPKVIERCFCEFKNGCATEEEKKRFRLLDKVKISLYELDIKICGSEVKIHPLKKIAIIADKSGLDSDNLKSALWVHLIKKSILAMAAKLKPLTQMKCGKFELENGNNNFGKQTQKLGNIIYDLNDMYVGGIVNGMLIGKSTIITKPITNADDEDSESINKKNNSIKRLKDAIESGNVAITVGSVRDSELPQGFKPPKGWIGSHLYCLDGFENGCFVLSDTRINSAKEVLIAEKDFFKLFDQINFADVKYNPKNQDAVAPKANGKVVENDPGQDENSSSLVIQ